MGLTFPDSGTKTTTGSESDIFSQVTATGLHACKVHLDAMQAGDIFVIKIYNYDQVDGTERLFGTFTYSDVQTEPTVFYDFIPSTRYKLSIQRTGGGDRQISWERVLVT